MTGSKVSKKEGRGDIPAPPLFSAAYALRLEYDGTAFAGWQAQPPRRTVQGVLEDALRKIFGTRVTTVGAGRTDTGVHAAEQAVTFRAPRSFPGDLAAALNRLLPEDAAVLSCSAVSPEAHARRDALLKIYRYAILNRPVRPVLDRSRFHWISRPLAVAGMKKEAKKWVGRRDFVDFAGPASRGLPMACHVRAIRIARDGDRLFIDITADRFLHNMVRRLAGRLVQAGWGVKNPKPLTLPPEGLTLLKVVSSRL